jgi:aconitate hydratase
VTQRVLLENLLRFEDGDTVTAKDIRALANWVDNPHSERGVTLNTSRVVLPNLSGVPMLANIRTRNHVCAPREGAIRATFPVAKSWRFMTRQSVAPVKKHRW